VDVFAPKRYEHGRNNLLLGAGAYHRGDTHILTPALFLFHAPLLVSRQQQQQQQIKFDFVILSVVDVLPLYLLIR